MGLNPDPSNGTCSAIWFPIEFSPAQTMAHVSHAGDDINSPLSEGSGTVVRTGFGWLPGIRQ